MLLERLKSVFMSKRKEDQHLIQGNPHILSIERYHIYCMIAESFDGGRRLDSQKVEFLARPRRLNLVTSWQAGRTSPLSIFVLISPRKIAGHIQELFGRTNLKEKQTRASP
mmetsp:Transcript_33847/g.70352  ORF Transcript_33847/g.70352 Transcript_33847/m.70352 type:complete len:111 (+) Transcript_33847:1852-2184(+)